VISDTALSGDQQLTGRIAEGVLDVSGGQPARVHLGDQPLQHLAVALQKAHQARAKRLAGATHLRHRDLDETLRSAQPAPLVTVARTELPILAALVAAPAAEEVGLLALHQLLHHQPGHQLHQRGDDVRLPLSATIEQHLQLLTRDHGRGYPSHRPAPSIVGPHHPT
jgi:hypothetical protein